MSHSGDSAGDALKKGVTSIHGLGEAIRGNINQFADSATNTEGRDNKNRNIAERGIDEMETGRYHGTGAGVTPADTTAEKVNRAAQGETGNTVGGTSTGNTVGGTSGTTGHRV